VAELVTRIDTSRSALCIQTTAPELVDSGGRVEQTDVLWSLEAIPCGRIRRMQ
jgi:hypothetical protein